MIPPLIAEIRCVQMERRVTIQTNYAQISYQIVLPMARDVQERRRPVQHILVLLPLVVNGLDLMGGAKEVMLLLINHVRLNCV